MQTEEEIIRLPFLSLTQTQKAMNCSRGFIYRMIKKGIITPNYILNKPYFLRKDIYGLISQEKDEMP